MQFKENTDSNKRSVYSDPLLVCISISRAQPPSHPIPSFTLSHPNKSRILSYPDFLSKEITAVVQCISSRRYTFANNTTQIEIKTQLNAGEREREKGTLSRLRQTFARFLIQKFFSEAFESQDSEVSLIDAQCLFQNTRTTLCNETRISNVVGFFYRVEHQCPTSCHKFHPFCNINSYI